MPPAARVADPTGHPGVITGPGVPTVLVVGMPAAVVGDLHTCSFPGTPPHPPTPFPAGSATVLIGGRPALRLGDMAGCGAPIILGAPTVMIGCEAAMSEWFIGSGIAYPMRIGPTGGLALASRDEEIAESIRLILGTSPGERPMRPEFGCPIHEHIFSPTDATTAGLIAFEVRQALRRWEPRIDVIDVEVLPDDDRPTLLHVDIVYAIRPTNDRRNLVFPFYVIPEEE